MGGWGEWWEQATVDARIALVAPACPYGRLARRWVGD